VSGGNLSSTSTVGTAFYYDYKDKQIGNALWLKTKIKDYIGTNAAGQTQDFAGARFIYSRELTLPGTALVDQPMSDRLNFTANASARLRQ